MFSRWMARADGIMNNSEPRNLLSKFIKLEKGSIKGIMGVDVQKTFTCIYLIKTHGKKGREDISAE